MEGGQKEVRRKGRKKAHRVDVGKAAGVRE